MKRTPLHYEVMSGWTHVGPGNKAEADVVLVIGNRVTVVLTPTEARQIASALREKAKFSEDRCRKMMKELK